MFSNTCFNYSMLKTLPLVDLLLHFPSTLGLGARSAEFEFSFYPLIPAGVAEHELIFLSVYHVKITSTPMECKYPVSKKTEQSTYKTTSCPGQCQRKGVKDVGCAANAAARPQRILKTRTTQGMHSSRS